MPCPRAGLSQTILQSHRSVHAARLFARSRAPACWPTLLAAARAGHGKGLSQDAGGGRGEAVAAELVFTHCGDLGDIAAGARHSSHRLAEIIQDHEVILRAFLPLPAAGTRSG